jgi:hypothetical protein
VPPDGTSFEIRVPAAIPAEAAPQDIPLTIVFEDEHLIVVDKPAGLVVHPAAGNLDGTLVNALLHHCRGQLSGIGGVERPGASSTGSTRKHPACWWWPRPTSPRRAGPPICRPFDRAGLFRGSAGAAHAAGRHRQRLHRPVGP